MFLLVLYSRDAALAGQRVELDPTAPLTLGRDRACTLSIQSDAVSRRHARVEWTDGGWRVVDEGSTNGTLVNDERAQITHLRSGDRIQVGDTILRMCSDDDPFIIIETEYRATSYDGLTGLFNRRHLLALLGAALQSDARPLAVLRFDVDGMRAVNDAHGHVAGDQLLVSLASLLRALVRPGELLARYGGDEFVLVLPGTDLAAATARGATLCVKLAERMLDLDGSSISARVSVGAAEAAANARSTEELLRLAEDNLLALK